MAGNENSLLQLELIREKDLSERHHDILNAFNGAMHPATWETAAEAARLLDESCPPLEEAEEAQTYLWSIWDLMISIAQSPEVTSEMQDRLVRIADSLRQCAKGELNVYGTYKRVWADLPMLPMCFEMYFEDPTWRSEEVTPQQVQIWRNFNAFGARCLGSGVMGTYDMAMNTLRSALEEPPTSVIEWKIQIACDWITHASKPLLWWARENIGYTDVPVEDTAAYVEGGSLYHGPATMCLQRWGFWIDRFEHFGKEESGMSEEVRKAALEAAQTMRRIEAGIGHTLAG